MKTSSAKTLASSFIVTTLCVATWSLGGTALGAVLDNFDDNVKTGWQDFTFVPGFGLPQEQNGQFVFSLPNPGQALFTGSRKISDELELKPGRTVELRVDLLEGNGKDSFAVLGFIPTANPLSSLAGYGFSKSTTDILLTKGINKYFLAEDGTAIKNENVTMVLRLVATANTVTITGQVLDKDDGNAVIWERTVVDTAAADVLAVGTDSPAAPYITKAHFSLLCYVDWDNGAQQPEYRVVYDNAVVCVLDDTVLDNFDDNTKTGWQDFTFVAGLGLPQEQNGQFDFTLPNAQQPIFTASRKNSRLLDLTDCGRLQLRVDMVHGEGKDSFAVLGFIPEANPLSSLAGYGLSKSSTDVLLTKGIGNYFYNEGLSLKNDNITLVLDLSVSNATDVHITGRILDKDDNNAVIWERTVVDTPAADVMADGTDTPAAPFLTRGHFSLFCYEDFDSGVQFPFYQVTYDNAEILAPAISVNTPPIISDVEPGETDNFLPASTQIRFKVQDDKPLVNGQISVTLNGTVYTTANGLTVTGSGNSRDVSLGNLTANTDYTALLRVVDSDNAASSAPLHFDTFQNDNLVIEMEDYNFLSGAFVDNPIRVAEGGSDPNSYSQTQGAADIDFHDTRGTPNGEDTQYRSADPIRMRRSLDKLRPQFDPGANVFDYEVLDIATGEWMNYTRTFPAGSYHVYLRESVVNQASAESRLEQVTGDRSVPDQTTRQLGTFLAPETGFTPRNIPLTDATGQKTILRLSGEHTLRLTQVTAGIAQNYLIFVPTADPGIQRATVTSVSPAAGSSLATVKLNLGATIQNRDTSVKADSITLQLNGVTVAATVTPTAEGATVAGGSLPLPPSGALNNAKLTFSDNLNVSQTTEWTFTLVYAGLNPANSTPVGSGLASGFTIRVAEGDPGTVPHENSLQQAEDILAGRYALAQDFTLDSLVVNQNKAAGNAGLFPDDELITALADFAVENVTYLQLTPGAYRFGGRTDDGFICSSGASLHDHSAAATLGFHNGGPADSPEESEFDFVVTQAGLYPFRFMWYERGGSAYGEFYSVDLTTGDRTLINDPNAPNAIKAFRTLSTARVNKSGTSDFTSIQDALNSGAKTIIITDSSTYAENIDLGSFDAGGEPVTLTSSQTGANRPVITPFAARLLTNSRRSNQGAGFAVYADNSVISNLIIEANPDQAMGAMMVMANHVTIENCLFRIAPATTGTLQAMNSLLFFAQHGDGSNTRTEGVNPTPNGADSDGCVVRNCEFAGVAPDVDPVEPTAEKPGYLTGRAAGGTGQGSGYVRMDHISDERDVTITLEGCYFHHCLDYGIFPTNGKDGAGSLNVIVRGCRFDANGKFQVRGRGANIFVEGSVFTRSNQARNGDGENSAVALQIQDAHVPSGVVSNCVFVNCGSANAQHGYYGGVNNHNANLLVVGNCTFYSCLSGVGAGTGGASSLSVRDSIFHQIGNNVVPAADAAGVTLTSAHPDIVDGFYPTWSTGLPNFAAGTKFSAVFNRYNNNAAQILIENCMVGTIASEDTRSWDEALAAGEASITGSRLLAGLPEAFQGTETVTRAVPIFVTTDPDAPNAFQLAPDSPGQGMGANVASVLGPNLILSHNAGSISISWTLPIWALGYELKSTPTLTNPVWTTVPGVVGNSVTIPIGEGNRFFAILKH